jgi:hypothetical protein
MRSVQVDRGLEERRRFLQTAVFAVGSRSADCAIAAAQGTSAESTHAEAREEPEVMTGEHLMQRAQRLRADPPHPRRSELPHFAERTARLRGGHERGGIHDLASFTPA